MPPDPWRQLNIEFADPSQAETIGALDIAPALNQATEAGTIDTWWYLRKPPGWRVRYRALQPPGDITGLLDKLLADGRISSWNHGIYEPETRAFGGPAAMDIVHTLFHVDSVHLLEHVAAPGAGDLGRRERMLLLYSVLLRSAGLDWFEIGDAWVKVAQLRPADRAHSMTPERVHHLAGQVRVLLTTHPAGMPLPATWTGAFESAGRGYAILAADGTLQRGLREALAHVFIFLANRAGLSEADQASLAFLAAVAVFDTPPLPLSPALSHPTSKVAAMTATLSDDAIADNPETASHLRNALVDRLAGNHTLRTEAVEQALRAVPRHLFVPEASLREAYLDDAVYTKRDEASGAYISAASQPTIVALMLEQVDVQPGDRVLELGAGTGYNAALLGHIAGPDGYVVTVDVDSDLVDGARAHLAAADVENVEAVLADGALGHAPGAPYERIIATVGAYELPQAWLDQLAPGGRLVVPLRLAGAACRSLVIERGDAEWVVRESELAVFMPLRGIGDDARRVVELAEGVTLQLHQDNAGATDADTLRGVLTTARHETWTGVLFGSGESFEWLDLFLACSLDNPIMRMNVEPEAKQAGLASPMFPTVAMATTTADGDLAYLTIRTAEPAPDGARRFEVGVIGHGASGDVLAGLVSDLIKSWDENYRGLGARIALPDSIDGFEPDPGRGRFLLARAHQPLTVTWQ